jgi:hypothetical protein
MAGFDLKEKLSPNSEPNLVASCGGYFDCVRSSLPRSLLRRQHTGRHNGWPPTRLTMSPSLMHPSSSVASLSKRYSPRLLGLSFAWLYPLPVDSELRLSCCIKAQGGQDFGEILDAQISNAQLFQ